MESGKQNKLIDIFLSMIDDDKKLIYSPILSYLIELGYKPQRQKTQDYVIAFKHTLHGKQIAKIGIHQKERTVFFALRFSACVKYSQKFSDVIRDMVLSSNQFIPMCDICKLCKGDKHVYTHELPGGEKVSRCGAYAYEIPDITVEDISEIKRLLNEQHAYFLTCAV